MNTFFLKINPKGCPGGISRPLSAEEWEKRPFELPIRATMSRGAKYEPASGDTIEIWVSERARDRTHLAGKGYTGSATVSKIEGTSMWVNNVDLSNPPLGRIALVSLREGAFSCIYKYSHPQLILLNRDQEEQLRITIIQARGDSAPSNSEPPDNDNALSAEYASPDPFDPDDVTDGRKRILRSIAERRGQKAFRDKLRAAYGNRCSISNCDVLDVLEAAHISPYRGPETNSVTNGLLLRADLHTLFDCGLITVDPETLRVDVAQRLRKSDYGCWHGSAVRIPDASACRPSKAALEAHFQAHRAHSSDVRNS